MRQRRSTRAQLNTAAGSNLLLQSELYHITDEDTLALGIGVNDYVVLLTGAAGSDQQVQYNDSGAFAGSSKFTWNNTTGVLTLNNTIQAPIETSLVLKAGNADAGAAGYIYLSPGEHPSNMSLVYLGSSGYSKSSIMLTVAGSPAAISLHIRSKGSGSLVIGDTPSSTNLFGSSLAIVSPTIQIGQSSFVDVIMSGGAGSSTDVTGTSITLKGGSAWTTGNNNGGHVYFYGGAPNGTGSRGNVYFGDGSNGYLPGSGTGTSVVLYNRTTGQLTYGDMSTGSSYTFQHSLTETTGVVNLVGDSASPGNSKLYGTNGSGTRGWYDIPAASNWSINSGRLYRNSKVLIGNGTHFGSYSEQLILHNTSGVSGLRIISGTETGTGWTIGMGCTIGDMGFGDLYFYSIYEQTRIIFGHEFGDLTMPGILTALKGDFTGGYGITISNPAKTFSYDIVPAAIAADRTLNLPLITGPDTLATLGLAQTFSANKTFEWQTLRLRNFGNTANYIITPSAITADRILSLPIITGPDTLATLGLAQIWTGKQTFYYQPQHTLGANVSIDNNNFTTFAGKIVYVNGAWTITILSTCPVDFHATFIRQGTGEVTFAAGSGVAIHSSGNKKRIDVRYEAAYIHVRSTGNVHLTGSLKT